MIQGCKKKIIYWSLLGVRGLIFTHTLSIVSSSSELLSSSSEFCMELSTKNDKSLSLISNATDVECSTHNYTLCINTITEVLSYLDQQ